MEGALRTKLIISYFYMILGAVVLPVSSPATEIPDEPGSVLAKEAFRIGPWVGVAQFSEEGAFFSCLMVANYGAGQSAAFGINEGGRFWLGLSSPDWLLARGGRYTLIYETERSEPVELSAVAPFSNTLMADFNDRQTAFSRLRQTQSLRVTVPELDETVRIGLERMNDALAALANCVSRNSKQRPGPDTGDQPQNPGDGI